MRLNADSASRYRAVALALLACAAAGITMLGGIAQLSLPGWSIRPLMQASPIPAANWPRPPLDGRSADYLQNSAIASWVEVIVVFLSAIVLLAAVSALIALLAHGNARRYETALRAVVGAAPTRIRTEHLRQGLLNLAVALAAGIPAGLLAALVAHRTWPHEQLGAVAREWVVVSLVVAAGVVALSVRSIANRATRSGWMGDALAPEARTNPGMGAEDLRSALLHLQFTFTFALLATALLVWQHARSPVASYTGQSNVPYVTRITLPPSTGLLERQEIIRTLSGRGLQVSSPGALVGVGATDHILADCGRCSANQMPLPMFALRTQQHAISEGFFDRIGGVLRSGREFEPSDAGARYVVVNDTFAQLAFQGQHAIGKRIMVGGLRGDWFTVIGVVRDLPIAAPFRPHVDDRAIIRSAVPGREPAVYFHVSDQPPTVLDVIRDTPARSSLPYQGSAAWTPLRELRAEAQAPALWLARVLNVLAILGAAVAVLSMTALTLLDVQERHPEIVVRRAVGARRGHVARLIVGRTLATLGRAVLVGSVLAILIARAVQVVLPQLRIFDLRVFGLTAALLFLAVLTAAAVPARAAVRIAPAQIHV